MQLRLAVFLLPQIPQLGLNEFVVVMILAQLLCEYLLSPLKVCICIGAFSLRFCRPAEVAQKRGGVEMVWPVLRFDDPERPVVVAFSIPQAAQIVQHVAQDARPQGNLWVVGTVDGFIDLQRPLKVQLRSLCIALGLEHSAQIVQCDGYVRMVFPVVGFL